MTRLKTFAGVALMLAGHGALAYHVHRLTFWPLRDAIAQTAAKSAPEGQVVAVSGEVMTPSMLDDPDHLWPRPMVVLYRVVERPYLDSDDDLRWSVEEGGPIPSKQWLAKEALIGELRLDPAEMKWSSVPSLAIDPEMVRHKGPAGATRARWDGELRRFYTTSAELQGHEVEMDRRAGKLLVTGLVRYQGVRSGDVITVVGRRKDGALVPFQYGNDGETALLAAPGKVTASELAAAHERGVSVQAKVELVASAFAACGGLVLVFKGLAGTGLWLVWGGLGHILGAIAGFGWSEAVPHLLLTAGAAGALLVTIFLASTAAQLWLPLGAWLCVLAVAVVLVRSRLDEGTLRELEDL